MMVNLKYPAVQWFAMSMERKLDLNRHKGTWIHCTPNELLKRLKEETQELEDEIKTGNLDNVLQEAADVANFAMMIADVCNHLKLESET